MNILQKKRLSIAPVLYWFLLAYIIVALVFWFLELQKQNHQMTNYKVQELKMDDPGYLNSLDRFAVETAIGELFGRGEVEFREELLVEMSDARKG